jgi:hypothetical protein
MQKYLLTLSLPVNPRQNTEATLKTYDPLFTETYITLLIHLKKKVLKIETP